MADNLQLAQAISSRREIMGEADTDEYRKARAVEAFHERHPDRALEINVTRHPYSFVGDRPAQPQKAGELDGIGTEASQLRTFADQMQGRFPAATAATTARRSRRARRCSGRPT